MLPEIETFPDTILAIIREGEHNLVAVWSKAFNGNYYEVVSTKALLLFATIAVFTSEMTLH